MAAHKKFSKSVLGRGLDDLGNGRGLDALIDTGDVKTHLVYGCPFIGFTSSKSDLELITRCIIKDFEGDEHAKLKEYATTDSPEYQRMVKEIAKRLGLTTLKFNKIETLIKSIGLPKCQVCTHCFDGSSCFMKKMKSEE